MRQLLILGFYCEVYRQEPLCRVYVNDVLLDEFDIPHTPRKEIDFPYIDILDPLCNRSYLNFDLNMLKTNPPFLKYIEFDDGDTNILNLKLKIQNDDNNHNNGFMTKYTYIQLSCAYLIPKKKLKNINTIKNNYKYTRQNWEKYNNIVNFYSYDNRNYLFPDLKSFIKGNFANINYLDNKIPVSFYKNGSTGYFYLTLQKKLGFWKPNTNVCKGYWIMGFSEYIECLYDKYKQHEDTRSTDT